MCLSPYFEAAVVNLSLKKQRGLIRLCYINYLLKTYLQTNLRFKTSDEEF